MPTAVPDRFQLEMRLGRDGDVEEWLATDTSLDRPVLVRSLGPESSLERRERFVAQVGAAATVSHPHLARVFAVEQVQGGAYSVSEWTGGATLADRVEAERPVELSDFLPNAAGLAGALAALHAQHVSHGAIDLSAVSYSSAHTAKLGAFGREAITDARGDVIALARVLETALTGSPPVGPPPSELVDGVPRSIDRILRAGQSGALTAADLEESLRTAPTPRSPRPGPAIGSRRAVIVALILILLAVGLVLFGRMVTEAGTPIIPSPPQTTVAGTPTQDGLPDDGTDPESPALAFLR